MERKVPLPDRWLRGLAEAPGCSPGSSRARRSRPPSRRFLAAPASRARPRPRLHVVPARGRCACRPLRRPGVLLLPGAGRLAARAWLAALRRPADVYASPRGTTAWVVDLPGGRAHPRAPPGASRGFSGEGGVLAPLTRPGGSSSRTSAPGLLGWQPVVDPADLAVTGLRATPRACAGWRGSPSSGRIGPTSPSRRGSTASCPSTAARMYATTRGSVSARALLESGERGAGRGAGHVAGPQRQPRRDLHRDGPTSSAPAGGGDEHQGTRGPCQHVLAVVLAQHESAQHESAQHENVQLLRLRHLRETGRTSPDPAENASRSGPDGVCSCPAIGTESPRSSLLVSG